MNSDLQVQVFDPTTISLIADNAGKLRTQGIEADMTWRISPEFSIRAAAAYNDAKYKEFVGACFEGQTIAQGCDLNRNASTGAFTSQNYGNRTPPKAPEFAARAGFTYDLPIGNSGGRLAFNGDAAYTSKYNFTDTLRPDAVQDDYVKFDASIAYHAPDDRWSLAVIGRNLTNELVVTAANDIHWWTGSGHRYRWSGSRRRHVCLCRQSAGNIRGSFVPVLTGSGRVALSQSQPAR
jgi:iron complex outermembrane receptor protein